MIMRNLVCRSLKANFVVAKCTFVSIQYNFVLFRLFKQKKLDQEKIKYPHPNSTSTQQHPENDNYDQVYDFMQRAHDMQAETDFLKQRNNDKGFIPDDIADKDFHQLVYWAQQISTPQKISQFVDKFNKVDQPDRIESSPFEQFRQKVIASVDLCSNFVKLAEYARFGFLYNINTEIFWQKLATKLQRFSAKGEEQLNAFVDTLFFVSSTPFGTQAFGYAQVLLRNKDLTLEQYTKLALAYFRLKIGGSLWVSHLMKGITNKIHEADCEILAQILPAIKMAKSVSDQLNNKISDKVKQLAGQMTFRQITRVGEYFQQNGEEQMWEIVKKRVLELLEEDITLKNKPKTLEHIASGILPTYKFSIEFVKKYVIEVIRQNEGILHELSPVTLSSISKALYIYELEKETQDIEQQLSALVISKLMKADAIDDWQLVQVVKDYNLCRHGSRMLYIFFEHLITEKYLQDYNAEMNRNVVEAFIAIYQNSGMCTAAFYNRMVELIG